MKILLLRLHVYIPSFLASQIEYTIQSVWKCKQTAVDLRSGKHVLLRRIQLITILILLLLRRRKTGMMRGVMMMGRIVYLAPSHQELWYDLYNPENLEDSTIAKLYNPLGFDLALHILVAIGLKFQASGSTVDSISRSRSLSSSCLRCIWLLNLPIRCILFQAISLLSLFLSSILGRKRQHVARLAVPAPMYLVGFRCFRALYGHNLPKCLETLDIINEKISHLGTNGFLSSQLFLTTIVLEAGQLMATKHRLQYPRCRI